MRISYKQLEQQNYCCYYCGQGFGELVQFKKKFIVLQPQNEHVIPYSFCMNNNRDNIVIACQICNRYKSDKIFDTMADLIEYLQKIWLGHKKERQCRKVKIVPQKQNVSNVESYSLLKEDGKDFVAQSVETPGTVKIIEELPVLNAEIVLPVNDKYIASTLPKRRKIIYARGFRR